MLVLIPTLAAILLTISHHTTSTPLSPSLPKPLTSLLHPNLTTPSTSTLQCIESPDWATSHFLAGDCYTCLDKFYNQEVDRYQGMMLEFLAKGIVPIFPGLFAQMTPRKYRYKSCTLAVVLLRDLPAGSVPGTTFPRSDLADYVELLKAAKNVVRTCLSVVLDEEADWGKGVEKGKGNGDMGGSGSGLGFMNPTGYEVVGVHDSIGVFIWDTNSNMNQRIQVPVSKVWDFSGDDGLGGSVKGGMENRSLDAV